MTYLDISNNLFTGAIPSWIGTLDSLQQLSIASNEFIGTLPSSFIGLDDLTHLYVQNNALDRLASHIAQIPTSLSGRVG